MDCLLDPAAAALAVAAMLFPGARALDARDHILSPDRTYAPYPGGWRPTEKDASLSKGLLLWWLQSPIKATKQYDPFVGQKIDPYLANASKVSSKIDNYDLQYVGVRYAEDKKAGGWTYQRNGKPGVLMHGILQNHNNARNVDLSREKVVADGGANYFDALVDADDEKIIWFSVHGLG